MKTTAMWGICFALLAIQGTCLAQYKQRKPEGEAFVQASPTLGDPFPVLDIYDGDGNELSTRSLRGHYTVLVFGCLT